MNTPLRADYITAQGIKMAVLYDGNGDRIATLDNHGQDNWAKAAAIVGRLNAIAAVIDGLDEISRDAWSGERDRMNRIGRMADNLKALAAGGGKE